MEAPGPRADQSYKWQCQTALRCARQLRGRSCHGGNSGSLSRTTLAQGCGNGHKTGHGRASDLYGALEAASTSPRATMEVRVGRCGEAPPPLHPPPLLAAKNASHSAVATLILRKPIAFDDCSSRAVPTSPLPRAAQHLQLKPVLGLLLVLGSRAVVGSGTLAAARYVIAVKESVARGRFETSTCTCAASYERVLCRVLSSWPPFSAAEVQLCNYVRTVWVCDLAMQCIKLSA